ncbi:hypothetical protein ACEWY4_005848 [Coilia grayii]|uniref:EF-hand domain-containing protein n=1 Tax=Coilia grayii TaxID=363190 RepID=A0ABD1KJV5_9TELE
MDEAGQRNFSKALAVATQIFNSLTEYNQIYGAPGARGLEFAATPVVGKTSGMSQKCGEWHHWKTDGGHISGVSNVEMILKFFDMFLKLKDLTTSGNFKEYDPDSKGAISKKEFQKSMENQRQYSQSGIEFLLSCVKPDENDIFNHGEFVERFHEPAKDIGFNVAVMLTNLSEHMPHDSRLATFLDLESSRTQWETPQVKESKRQFILDVVNEGGESEKMERFVNFCEDTIFEMQLASQIFQPDALECPEEDEEDDSQSVAKKPDEEDEDNALECSSAFPVACVSIKKSLSSFRNLLTFKSMRQQYKRFRKMSIREMAEREQRGEGEKTDLEDGKKKDLDKSKDETAPDTPMEEERSPPKNRPRQQEEPPEAFMASFFTGLEIYQTKMLVPLVVFKREKEIARKLEFDGLHITKQPSDDDIKGQWDRLVLPNNCWDKFVKCKVINKYGDLYGAERIAELLGLDKSALDFHPTEEAMVKEASLVSWLSSIDTKYHIWKMGVVFTDSYTTMSILGHYDFNNFFFAAHLLDIAMGFKTLRTILSLVTHNGKQLVLTVGLPAVVVCLYTVVAFNFFRKFYNKSEDEDELDMKCDNMMTIEDQAGDPYDLYCIVFDIPFFFVIAILLAIIQGLIIDAFGELRDQQEQVKEDIETKCFICVIANDYFDTTPHGFDTHTLQEHNLANYLFSLYIINKDETEHTGQESYVWKMYQERCWDFFPAGDCFRKQHEDQLG